MIKVKLFELKNSEVSLKALSYEKLFGKKALHVEKLIEAAAKEIDIFEKIRHKKVEEYGEKNEDGSLTVKPENMECFLKEMEEITMQEVELPVEKLSFDFFDDIKIEPHSLMLLRWGRQLENEV